MPLKAVLLSYIDTNSAKEVKGTVERRGLCGDVYLVSTPAAARITDVKIDTSVRKGEIALSAALDRSRGEGALYRPRRDCEDGHHVVHQFTSKPFKVERPEGGRFTVREKWKPEKLWDTHTPQNVLTASVSLLGRQDKLLDAEPPGAFRIPRVLDRRQGLLPERHAHLSLRRAAGQRRRSARGRRLTKGRGKP